MKNEKKLWKTTIVIWSDSNPYLMETSDLVQDAMEGESWMESSTSEYVVVPEDFENMEFFFPEHDEDE